MKTIKPTPDYIFAKPDETESTTKSGFMLDNSQAERPLTAQVINVGAYVEGINKGDTIIYKSYTTTDIKLEDVDYILLKEEDVCGVIVDE